MIVPDVNILVHAHRVEHPAHDACRRVLDDLAPGVEVGLAMPVVTGFLRLVTHPRVFAPATPMATALQVITEWSARPPFRWVVPGDGHFALFADLCRRYAVIGSAVYDLHLAALAVEHDAELCSLDAGFARIRELRWRDPSG